MLNQRANNQKISQGLIVYVLRVVDASRRLLSTRKAQESTLVNYVQLPFFSFYNDDIYQILVSALMHFNGFIQSCVQRLWSKLMQVVWLKFFYFAGQYIIRVHGLNLPLHDDEKTITLCILILINVFNTNNERTARRFPVKFHLSPCFGIIVQNLEPKKEHPLSMFMYEHQQ